MSTISTPSTSSTPPPGDESRALRAALDAGAPEPSDAMRAALASFRTRLPRHRAIRRLERGSIWYWLFAARRTLRWAALGLAFLILAASLTATGRAMMVRAAGLTFDSINGFVKMRVDAGYDTYENYRKWKGYFSVKSGMTYVQDFLGVAPDGRLILLTNYGQNANLHSLWALNPTDGKYTVLHDKTVDESPQTIASTGNAGTIEGVVYTTANTGMGTVIRASLSGLNRTKSLWFHNLSSPRPILIDDSPIFYQIFFSPAHDKICYTRSDRGFPAIMIWERETHGLSRVYHNGLGVPMAFGPRGDSLIILEQRINSRGFVEIAGIRQVDLKTQQNLATLEFPSNRRLLIYQRFKDCLLFVHANAEAGVVQGYGPTVVDQQIKRLAFEPALHFIDTPLNLEKDEVFADSVQDYPANASHFFTFTKAAMRRDIYDVLTGQRVGFTSAWPLNKVFWSPDARRLAVDVIRSHIDGINFIIHDLATGKEETFAGSGKLLGWAGDNSLIFRDDESYKRPPQAPTVKICLKIFDLETKQSKIVQAAEK